MQTNEPATLLEASNLRVHFHSPEGLVRAVEGVDFHVQAGETVALVGESGCGKSVTALALGRLFPSPPGYLAGGEIRFDGVDVLNMGEADLRRLRGAGIAYVFQEPGSSLNPVFTIGNQIREALRLHARGGNEGEVEHLLRRVGMSDPDRVARSYPHELSGGMQQRAMIAMALAGRPRLLVADEPTTALDVTLQAQILDLLSSLRRDSDLAVLLITHNLGLVAEHADRVYVMYAGRIVESGPVAEVLERPAHPYTRGLLRAVPRLEGAAGMLEGIDGVVPSPAHWPEGCVFHPRCAWRKEVCVNREPGEETVSAAWRVKCHFWKEVWGTGEVE